jgi:hypothetical protein
MSSASLNPQKEHLQDFKGLGRSFASGQARLKQSPRRLPHHEGMAFTPALHYKYCTVSKQELAGEVFPLP